ncbi:MAG: DUF1566 domain-containing protein [Lautropia sp.]
MNAFRDDLQALVSRHIARAPVPKLLRLVDALDDEQPIAFGKAATTARFTQIGPDGKPLLDAQDGEHVATYDALTGLNWLAAPVDCGEQPWQAAMEAAGKVRLFGFTDWRAPTIQEQLSIIDYTRCDPAVDETYFKGPHSWVWTSTVAASPAGYAWYVYLDDGHSSRGHPTTRLHVRAVRAGQVLELGL